MYVSIVYLDCQENSELLLKKLLKLQSKKDCKLYIWMRKFFLLWVQVFTAHWQDKGKCCILFRKVKLQTHKTVIQRTIMVK